MHTEKNNFYLDVIDQKRVWTIKDSYGFPAPKNTSGQRVMPFWSKKNFVEEIIAQHSDYSSFEPFAVSLSDFLKKWLVGLKKDGILVGINWSGKNVSGYDLDPKEVMLYLENLQK